MPAQPVQQHMQPLPYLAGEHGSRLLSTQTQISAHAHQRHLAEFGDYPAPAGRLVVGARQINATAMLTLDVIVVAAV